MFVFENTTHWIVRLPRPLKGIFNKLFTTWFIQEFTTRNLHCFALRNDVCLIVKVEEAIKEQLIFYTGIFIMFQTFYCFYGLHQYPFLYVAFRVVKGSYSYQIKKLRSPRKSPSLKLFGFTCDTW